MSNSRPRSDYLRLCKAIEKRDDETARNLIRNNVNVNISNVRGNTPLHWATITYNLDLMTMLLDKGANIHAKNHQNYKPLDVAIQHYSTPAALLLIKRGALIGEDLNALLLKLIKENRNQIVKILIDELQNNPSIDWKVAFDLAISEGIPLIIGHILPHCRFLKPSDKYIPREYIVNPAPHCKECVKVLLKWDFTVSADSAHDNDFVYEAVKDGYLPIVLKLLKFGIDVDMVNSKTGLSLLKLACVKKHYEIVESLLKHNACLNVKTPTNTKILKKLSRYSFGNMLPHVHDKYDLKDITCLHIAVLNSDDIMTRLLLKYGATIIDDPKYFKVACIAVRNNCEEIVRMFLERGVNITNIDSKGRSLLHFCILSNHGRDDKYNITKLLLDKGAAIHIQTPRNSLIFETIKNRHSKTAQLFLDYNADVQYISPDGDTLLHEAIRNNFDIEFLQSLLKLNLPVNAVNNKMQTPLLIACRPYFENLFEIIRIFLDYDVNINCTDENLMTPLHFACSFKNLEVVTLLLKKEANPHVKNNKGQTPLHFVCAKDNNVNIYFETMNKNALGIIQLLLIHNAHIEAVDEKGWTPLFEACKAGNDLAVKCLLDNHANPNHTDLQKLTPIYVAMQYCSYHFKVIEILLERKVNVNCIDELGKSIVHIIVEKDHEELIKSFAHTLVNFNSVDLEGNSPLHIAVHKESVKMILSLIKYGANVNILNKKRQTPVRIILKKALNYRKKYKPVRDDPNVDFYDSWAFFSDMIKYKNIVRSLNIHIVKLNVAGLKVNNQNFDIIYNSDDCIDDGSSDEEDVDKLDIVQLEIKCEREIEKMKMENIGVSKITLCDFLTKNIHFLSKFVKNKKINQTLDLEIYDRKFPLYMDIVRNRFRDAKFRYRMINLAKKCFISNITQRLSNECIDTIFSYLKMKDLNIFIRAMKGLDE